MFPCTPTTLPAPHRICHCGCSPNAPPLDHLSPLAQSEGGGFLWKILEHTPQSAFLLAVVSRALNQCVEECVRISVTDIFTHCSTRNAVFAQIQSVKADHENWLVDAPQGSLPHSYGIAHQSLVFKIRSLGVAVPGRILSSQEIAAYSLKIQDANLQKIWQWTLRPRLQQGSRGLGIEVPFQNQPGERLRTWMLDAANRPILERVTDLDLKNCALTYAPMVLGLFTGLQELDLSNNGLVALDPGMFQSLRALRTLDLSNNRLVFLEPDGFQGLSALRKLQLHQNLLTSLEPLTFHGLSALQELCLGGNRLSFVGAGVFDGLSELRTLDLTGNPLTSFDTQVFLELPALKQVCLSNYLPDPLQSRKLEEMARSRKIWIEYPE